ncbi:MAG: TerC family protein [Desulfobacteraceae bacterium]|nr:TerC family protein [Desulfobacteraceae bacterium]
MVWLTDPEAWVAFVTLVALEIVLGIDNIIFITILAGKLPPARRRQARTVGLALAMITRIILLLSIFWIVRLTEPMFWIFGQGISGRDLILIGGGVFLLAKSTHEIHQSVEGGPNEVSVGRRAATSFIGIVVQIALLDIVFSFDSVLTAIGMSDHIEIMIAAVVAAVIFMMFASAFVARFIERHPTIKILALSFLLMVGLALILEGFERHVPKGYIYFAMAFSVFVEMLNSRARKNIQKFGKQ